MSAHYEPLREAFSTADAECPILLFQDRRLRVTYRNWQGQMVKLLLHEVVGISWDEGDTALEPGHRDDESYLVVDSEWLQRHLAAEGDASRETPCHFKLCFNAVGVLQVLASRLEVVT